MSSVWSTRKTKKETFLQIDDETRAQAVVRAFSPIALRIFEMEWELLEQARAYTFSYFFYFFAALWFCLGPHTTNHFGITGSCKARSFFHEQVEETGEHGRAQAERV